MGDKHNCRNFKKCKGICVERVQKYCWQCTKLGLSALPIKSIKESEDGKNIEFEIGGGVNQN